MSQVLLESGSGNKPGSTDDRTVPRLNRQLGINSSCAFRHSRQKCKGVFRNILWITVDEE